MRLLIVLLFSAAPAAVFASQGGGHAEGSHGAGPWLMLGFTAVNFSLFVYFITRFARSPLRDFLVKRRKELVEAMSAASRAKEEAEKIKAEYAEKVAQLEHTRARLIAEVTAIAEAERERGLVAAREAGKRLQRDAERRAKSDLEQARRELRAHAAALASEIAKREIQAMLDASGRRRLLAEFVDKVKES